jgi:hypothetical protein
MEKKERRIYQIMDADCNYRSCIVYNGEELDYISKERTKAIVYTYDEAKKVAKYYIEEKNIPVMIECRTVYSKKDI